MNTRHTDNTDHLDHLDHPDRLISRIVDGDADAATWDALVECAAAQPSVWKNLGEAQRDHAMLRQAMSRAATLAETVAAPTGLLVHAPAVGPDSVDSIDIIDRVRAAWWNWAGWSVAALLAVAWAVGFSGRAVTSPNPDAPREARASLVPFGSSQDAFDAYMERGRAEGTVLSDQPRRLLIDTRPAPGGAGGVEVIFIQQVMERAVVPDLYQFRGSDEQGRPALVRYQQPERGRM